MATQTTNYGFKKPDGSDFYNIQDQNDNWDIADEKIKEAADSGYDPSTLDRVEIGTDAVAVKANSIAIGVNVNAQSGSAQGDQDASVAIGNNVSGASNAVAIGRNVSTVKFGIAIGKDTYVNDVGGIAIGYAANTNGYAYRVYSSVAVGEISKAPADGSVAFGSLTNAAGNNGVAVGLMSKVYAEAERGIAIGSNAKSGGFENPNTGILENAYDSIAIGSNATVYRNSSIAIGENTRTIADNFVAIGKMAHSTSSSSQDGIAIGNQAQSEGCGVAIGAIANAYGGWCVAIGMRANAAKGSVAIGTVMDGGARGENSVAIGKYSNVSEGANCSMALGYNASTGLANTIQMGDYSVTAFKCKVQVTTTSDERDKTDIENIEKATEFLRAIRSITYVRNDRDAYAYPDEKLSEKEKENVSKYGFRKYNKREHKKGTLKGERRRAGVIAQEVRQAMLDVYGDDSYANLVDDDLYNFADVPEGVESHLGVMYENFVPFLIKAIQELDARVQDLESKLSERDSAGK